MSTSRIVLILFSMLIPLFMFSCNPGPPEPSDRDGDGMEDNKDQCPDVFGPVGYNGCPDSDLDGIPNNVDQCPSTSGTAQYNGCPPPDSDGDGILDNEDNCPNEAGESGSYHGCPWWKVDICFGQSYKIDRTKSGKIIRWPQPQAGFYYADNLPASYRQVAYDATASWQQYSTGSRFVLVTYGTVSVGNRRWASDGKNVISYLPFGSDTLGMAYTWGDGTTGAITEVDIVIGSNKPWNIGASPGYYDIQSVIVHELGHACGLKDLYDLDDRTQTMYGHLHDNSTIQRTLCDGDKAGMKYLYPW